MDSKQVELMATQIVNPSHSQTQSPIIQNINAQTTIIVETANREAPFFSDPTDVVFPQALIRKRQDSNKWDNYYSVKSLLVDMSRGLKRIPNLEFYEYNKYPLLYCIIFAGIVGKAGFNSSNEWFLLLFLIPTIAIIRIIIRSRQWESIKEVNPEKYGEYSNFVNYVFHIRDDENSVIPIDFLHKFALYVIFGGIIVGIQMVLVQLLFSPSWRDNCDEIVIATSDDITQGACLARHSAFMCTYTYFGYSFGVVLALLRGPRKDYMTISQQLRSNLKNKYEQGRIKFDTIDKRITKTVQEFISTNNFIQELRNLPCKCCNKQHKTAKSACVAKLRIYGYMVIVICIVLAPFYVSPETYIFNMDFSNGKSICALIMFSIDIPFSTFMLVQVWQVCWQGHSIFLSDYVPMDSLSGAIYITNIDDIVCWWEIRQFYRYYQQPLFSGGRGSLMFGSILLFSTLCLTFSLYKIVIKDQNFNFVTASADGVVTMFVVISFVIIMIRYLMTAIKTTIAQKNHVRTLEYELIRMKILLNALNDKINDFDDTKDDPDAKIFFDEKDSKTTLEQASKATQLFIQFLTKYDETPTILGIPMNKTILFTGLFYVISCFLTIGSSLFF